MHRVVALAVAALLVSSCGGSTSSTDGRQPLPTIGLGSDIGGAEISGGADLRVVGSTEIDTLVMVGDSITVAATPALEDAFARLGFANVNIEAQESKRTVAGGQSNPSGVQVVADLIDEIESAEPGEATDDDPFDHSNELWVVALGTNDIAQYSDPAERAAVVNEMLNNIPAESMLVWVDTYWDDRSEGTADMNETIADRVRQRGNSVMAEWSAVAADDGNLRTDGVHPRDQGTIVFANVVGNTIIELLQLR